MFGSHGSRVVKHLPHHPNVKAASTDTGRENGKMLKKKIQNVLSVVGSIVVEHSPHHPKVEDSSSATANCIGREKIAKY